VEVLANTGVGAPAGIEEVQLRAETESPLNLNAAQVLDEDAVPTFLERLHVGWAEKYGDAMASGGYEHMYDIKASPPTEEDLQEMLRPAKQSHVLGLANAISELLARREDGAQEVPAEVLEMAAAAIEMPSTAAADVDAASAATALILEQKRARRARRHEQKLELQQAEKAAEPVVLNVADPPPAGRTLGSLALNGRQLPAAHKPQVPAGELLQAAGVLPPTRTPSQARAAARELLEPSPMPPPVAATTVLAPCAPPAGPGSSDAASRPWPLSSPSPRKKSFEAAYYNSTNDRSLFQHGSLTASPATAVGGNLLAGSTLPGEEAAAIGVLPPAGFDFEAAAAAAAKAAKVKHKQEKREKKHKKETRHRRDGATEAGEAAEQASGVAAAREAASRMI
jgi:hypothetical protein